jgi:hypothetical protein
MTLAYQRSTAMLLLIYGSLKKTLQKFVELLENRRLTVRSIAEQANIDREAGQS